MICDVIGDGTREQQTCCFHLLMDRCDEIVKLGRGQFILVPPSETKQPMMVSLYQVPQIMDFSPHQPIYIAHILRGTASYIAQKHTGLLHDISDSDA